MVHDTEFNKTMEHAATHGYRAYPNIIRDWGPDPVFSAVCPLCGWTIWTDNGGEAALGIDRGAERQREWERAHPPFEDLNFNRIQPITYDGETVTFRIAH